MNRRLRWGLVALTLVLIGGGGFWVGYRVGSRDGNYRIGYEAGVRDSTPQHRALVVVRRNPDTGSSSGHSVRWFDLRKSGDAARLWAEDRMLTAQGVDHYITEAKFETSMAPVIPPNRIDAHR